MRESLASLQIAVVLSPVTTDHKVDRANARPTRGGTQAGSDALNPFSRRKADLTIGSSGSLVTPGTADTNCASRRIASRIGSSGISCDHDAITQWASLRRKQ